MTQIIPNQFFINVQKTKKGYIITKTNNFIWNVASTKHPLRTVKDVYNIRVGRKNGIIENTYYANNSLLDVENINIREFSKVKKIVDITYIKRFIAELDTGKYNIDDIIDNINEIIELYGAH